MKRKQCSDIRYFTKPFRSFKYRSHHEGQHAATWTEYQGLSFDEKKKYFGGRIKSTNTLHNSFDLDKDTYEFTISTDIVEVIISDLFFRDDEQLEDTESDDNNGDQNQTDTARKKLIKKQNEKTNAMKLFCKEEDASVYAATIKNFLRFDLVMDYVGIGLSFRQTAAVIQKAQNCTKTAKLAGLNDCILGQYTRGLVAVALQQMATILDDEPVWTMSLAGDGSSFPPHKHTKTGYLF